MKPRVLYLASGSINEPLIVSQVVRYLKRLNTVFEACHLVTLERKPIPAEQSERIKADLKEHNIDWHSGPCFPGFRVVNTLREIWNGYQFSKSLVESHDLNLVHARSFIPGNVGLRLAKKTGVKFLYDMRGFWAEEKWAKGTIKSTWLKSKAQAMEDRLFHQADALVSLTHSGKNFLSRRGIKTPIDVIPCCVDTDLFRPSPKRKSGKMENWISVGSLGPGYLADSVLGIFKAANDWNSNCRLQLLTRSKQKTIASAARDVGLNLDSVKINSAKPSEVVNYLQAADIGLCMIQPSFAKTASSPTKMAEYLACGIPVIANCNGIGDMAEIVNDNRVGIDLKDLTPRGWTASVKAMKKLIEDDDLAMRCRQLAIEKFSVEVGVKTYGALYRRLMQPPVARRQVDHSVETVG